MATASNQNYTLTYDPGSKGFPSFYSYAPDWMIGMNNFFYTFRNGNLYRHNTNELRNNYYGINYPSTLTSVFNDQPLENKLFKTINLEGDDSWGVTLESDQQTTGFINNEFFEKKEGSYFGYIRNSGSTPALLDNYALRSLNGLGNTTTVVTTGTTQILSYPTTLFIGNIVSIGDMVYYGHPNPVLAGQISDINQNLSFGVNTLTIDNTTTGAVPIPSQEVYTLYIKNSVAESHGVLGHYGVFKLTNSNTSKIELFAVLADVMKSFP